MTEWVRIPDGIRLGRAVAENTILANPGCWNIARIPKEEKKSETMIDYDNFKKSLKHLELQYENYRTLDASLSDLTREGVAESVIQRFETCYDSLWKVLKRYLQEKLGIPDVTDSPKKIFRLAADNELFESPFEQWRKYADARIATTHDDSGEKAAAARRLMNDFIHDAISLYRTMSGETWD